jgi:hypothetical protein
VLILTGIHYLITTVKEISHSLLFKMVNVKTLQIIHQDFIQQTVMFLQGCFITFTVGYGSNVKHQIAEKKINIYYIISQCGYFSSLMLHLSYIIFFSMKVSSKLVTICTSIHTLFIFWTIYLQSFNGYFSSLMLHLSYIIFFSMKVSWNKNTLI